MQPLSPPKSSPPLVPVLPSRATAEDGGGALEGLWKLLSAHGIGCSKDGNLEGLGGEFFRMIENEVFPMG